MSCDFLYFLPDRNTVSAADMAALGLGHAFDDKTPLISVQLTSGGPGGARGMLAGHAENLPISECAYKPDEQTWRKIPNSKAGVWCGMYDDSRPTAKELGRATLLGGHWVDMANGDRFLAPIARRLVDLDGLLQGQCALPVVSGVAENGEWTRTGVEARYTALWDLAVRYWDARYAAIMNEPNDAEPGSRERSIEFDFAGTNDAALLALGQNYRVSAVEVGLLGLFSDRSTSAILEALVDGPTQISFLKKKLQEKSDG